MTRVCIRGVVVDENVDEHGDYVVVETTECVLSPEVAATAATLVDLAGHALPPHVSEARQVEAYLALRRVAEGRPCSRWDSFSDEELIELAKALAYEHESYDISVVGERLRNELEDRKAHS